MAAPAFHTLPPMVQGDTWEGIPFIAVTVNNAFPSVPLAAARLQFRRSPREAPGASLSTENGGVLITHAGQWEMSVPASNLPLSVGEWLWDLETEDSAGVRKTYLEGKVAVLADITRPPYGA